MAADVFHCRPVTPCGIHRYGNGSGTSMLDANAHTTSGSCYHVRPLKLSDREAATIQAPDL